MLAHAARRGFASAGVVATILNDFLLSHLQQSVDQGCAALLCYKFHRLTVTLPVASRDFWRYLPSCLLADLIVIVGLRFLCRRIRGSRRWKHTDRRVGHRYFPSTSTVADEENMLLQEDCDEKSDPDSCIRSNSQNRGRGVIALTWTLTVICVSLVTFTVLAIGAFHAGGKQAGPCDLELEDVSVLY